MVQSRQERGRRREYLYLKCTENPNLVSYNPHDLRMYDTFPRGVGFVHCPILMQILRTLLHNGRWGTEDLGQIMIYLICLEAGKVSHVKMVSLSTSRERSRELRTYRLTGSTSASTEGSLPF